MLKSPVTIGHLKRFDLNALAPYSELTISIKLDEAQYNDFEVIMNL